MIGIVDIEMGNLRSVQNAVLEAGHDVAFVRDARSLEDVTHLLVPGVGSFFMAMERMRAAQLVEPIRAFAATGRPLLGICLGMQLLAGFGDEGGGTEGLGLVGGRVVRFEPGRVPRVPHVGWNDARVRRAHPLWKRLRHACDFYFVHSYHFVPTLPGDVLADVEYGGSDYVAVVAHDNVVGVQFHPEKSQGSGLKLLENFCDWDGRC